MKISHRKTFFQTGFTMIELMIVVAIIATLSTIIYANVSESRAIARDKQRIAELEQIAVALNLYKATNDYYPKEGDGMNGEVGEDANITDALKPYMPNVPMDPRGDSTPYDNNFKSEYAYYYDGKHWCYGPDGASATDDLEVALIFARNLESTTGNGSEVCPGGLGGWAQSNNPNAYIVIVGPSDG